MSQPGMTDADLFGLAPTPTAAGPQGDPAVWTVLGEAGGHTEGQRAVASTIANRAKLRGSSAADIVSDPGQGYEAWAPAKRADLQKKYPPGSPEYEAARANVEPILTGHAPAPYAYDSFYSPTAQKSLGRKPPAWDDGSGTDIGGNSFFTGKYSAPEILSDEDKAAWEKLQGAREVAIAPSDTTPQPGKPATSQADTAKFLHLHGFFDTDAKPGSAQLPLMETDKSGPPSTPGTWYIPREGGLRQVGSDVPDYLPQYRSLIGTQKAEMEKPMLGRLALGAGQGVSDVAGSINKLTGGGFATSPDLAQVDPELSEGLRTGSIQGFADQRNRFNLVHGVDPAATTGRMLGNLATVAPTLAMGEGALGALGAGVREAAPALGPALDFASGNAGADNLLIRAPSMAAHGAQQGAAVATLNSSQSDRPLGEQMVHGAKLGAAMTGALPAFGATGNMLFGGGSQLAPEVASLADLATQRYGIPLRRSQIIGVGDRNAAIHDSQMIGRAGTGYAENNARQGQAFARAASRTIGEDAPLTPEVMDRARQRIGGVFEQAARNTGIAADDQLRSDLAQVGSQARELGLDQSQINALDMQIGKITDLAARHGDVIPGDAYQALTESGSSLSRIMKNGHSSFADLATDIRGAVDDAVARAASPEDAAALRQARFQWKNLKTLQPLAAKAGPDGSISPALLRGRVMTQFPDFAFGGGGDLGDLARIGQTFMKEPGNSQTPARLKEMLTGAVLGGGGVGEAILASHDPMLALKLAGGAAGLGALRYGSNAIAGAYNRSPSVVNRLITQGTREPDTLDGVYRTLREVAGPAYVPLGVTADRNRLLSLPRPEPVGP